MDFQVNIRHPHLFAQLSRELADNVLEAIESANVVPVTAYTGVRLQPAFRAQPLKADEVTSHVQVFGGAIAKMLDEQAENALVHYDEATASDDDQAISDTLVDLAAFAGAMKERSRQAALMCPGDEHMAERLQAADRLGAILDGQINVLRNAYLLPGDDQAPDAKRALNA